MDFELTVHERYQELAETCMLGQCRKSIGNELVTSDIYEEILNEVAMLGFLQVQIQNTNRKSSPGPNEPVQDPTLLGSLKALKENHHKQKVILSLEAMRACNKSTTSKRVPPSAQQVISKEALTSALSADDLMESLGLQKKPNEASLKMSNEKQELLQSHEGLRGKGPEQPVDEMRFPSQLPQRFIDMNQSKPSRSFADFSEVGRQSPCLTSLSQDFRRSHGSNALWEEIEMRGKNHTSSGAYRAPIQQRMGADRNHPAMQQRQGANSFQQAPCLDNEQRRQPFMTASAYYQQENMKNGNGQMHQPSRPTMSDEWHDDDISCSELQQGRPAPIMGGGLRKKRKFKPPARIGEQGSSGSGNRPPGLSAALDKSSKSDPPNEEKELPEALKGCDPQLIEKIENEIIHSGDPITFDDVAGLEFAKKNIEEMVIWPMKRPDLFVGLRTLPKGLLLFGPPGTGKTMIGKAIAHQSGATFFSISASSLTSKWIGEGEKLVRTLFAVARHRQPAIVFIDEVDSLLTMRTADENEASRRIKTEFLVQLDGAGTHSGDRVLVVGATNRPQELDEAARRRFVKRLYIPLPDEAGRLQLLNRLLQDNQHCLTPGEIQRVVQKTDGFSGADVRNLCTEAALAPLRELGSRILEISTDKVPAITMTHFLSALECMGRSVSPSEIEFYLEWNQTFGTYERSKATNG